MPHREVRRATVVIPARDEASCVDGVLADLGRQRCAAPDDHAPGREGARPHMEVVVVDDRSTDGTGAAASRAIAAAGLESRATVVRRSDGADGKGAALAVLEHDGDPGRVIVVLDADARVGPTFVAACMRSISSGTPAVAARRRMLRPRTAGRRGRLLAMLQDDEQTMDDIVQRGRAAWGGAAELRGNGMVLRADLLDAVGGWPRDALCEDLELSTIIRARHGSSVARSPDVVVWEQPVSSMRALLTQRMRWAEGFVRRDLRVTLPMLVASPLSVRARFDVAAYALQGLAPWIAVGIASSALRRGPRRSRRIGAELLAGYAAGALVLAAAGIRERAECTGVVDGASPLRDATRLLAVLLLLATWPVLLPVAWIRVARHPAGVAFARTRHGATRAFSPPAAVSPPEREPAQR